MSKKMILLALAAANVAVFALPAMAMAVETDVSLHAVGVPLNQAQPIAGDAPLTLTGVLNQNVVCPVSSGSATFTSTTTGTLQLTFGSATQPCTNGTAVCTTEGQAAGVIKTLVLPVHLVTAVDTKTGSTGPGVLITPNGGSFETFTCGVLHVTVSGSGLVGTITKPKCGESSNEATMDFSSSSATVQTHKTVASEDNGVQKHTATEYNLTAFGAAGSVNWSGIIRFSNEVKLECT